MRRVEVRNGIADLLTTASGEMPGLLTGMISAAKQIRFT